MEHEEGKSNIEKELHHLSLERTIGWSINKEIASALLKIARIASVVSSERCRRRQPGAEYLTSLSRREAVMSSWYGRS
jgi:hypothetical protein